MRSVFYAFVFMLSAAFLAVAQTKQMLPFDHIHLNEPGAQASVWWEKNIPGGRRITEAPDRIMYGAVRLMFLGSQSTGGSRGSVIEHIGFSVPDIDATMRALATINTKVIEPVKNVPGLYKTALRRPARLCGCYMPVQRETRIRGRLQFRQCERFG